MNYITTSEIHTEKDRLVNANSILQDTLNDLNEEKKNIQEKIKQINTKIRENTKSLNKHTMITENRHIHCLECGYVEAKLED